jgi:hypothetical protein
MTPNLLEDKNLNQKPPSLDDFDRANTRNFTSSTIKNIYTAIVDRVSNIGYKLLIPPLLALALLAGEDIAFNLPPRTVTANLLPAILNTIDKPNDVKEALNAECVADTREQKEKGNNSPIFFFSNQKYETYALKKDNFNSWTYVEEITQKDDVPARPKTDSKSFLAVYCGSIASGNSYPASGKPQRLIRFKGEKFSSLIAAAWNADYSQASFNEKISARINLSTMAEDETQAVLFTAICNASKNTCYYPWNKKHTFKLNGVSTKGEEQEDGTYKVAMIAFPKSFSALERVWKDKE